MYIKINLLLITMRKKCIFVLLIISLIVLSSCNPKISTSLTKNYPPIDYKQEILVIGLGQEEPKNSEVLGVVKIGDTGFTTKCGYDIVIDKAKLEARKAGGNALKIIEHKPPTILGSTCHRIKAKVLRVQGIEAYEPTRYVDSTLINANYALLHVYRNSGAGALVSYDLYLGDSTICRVKNRWRKSIRIKKDGLNMLWAKTEVKKELPINITMGKEYYIRCGIAMGAFVGRPSLEVVDNINGKAEFEAIKIRESDKRNLLVLHDGREIECVVKNEDDKDIFFTIFKNDQKIETKISKEKVKSIEHLN
jgi:hypothetical protein